jgi:hypothetical protein
VKLRLVLIILTLFACGPICLAQNISVYTSLERTQCRTLKTETTGAGDYAGRCPGTDGYFLTLLEGDLRQNLIVVTPGGTKHSLALWDVVSGGFSHVGVRAEWRTVTENGKRRPFALIVRYHVAEDADHPDRKTSYLIVTKITSDEICVTDKIPAAADSNQTARNAADNSASKPCLKKP